MVRIAHRARQKTLRRRGTGPTGGALECRSTRMPRTGLRWFHGGDGADERLLPAARRALTAALGVSLLAVVAVAALSGLRAGLLAVVPAAGGLGFLAWRRARHLDPLRFSVVVDA